MQSPWAGAEHEHGRVDGDAEGLEVSPVPPEVERQGDDSRDEERDQNSQHLHLELSLECRAKTTEISDRAQEKRELGAASQQRAEHGFTTYLPLADVNLK